MKTPMTTVKPGSRQKERTGMVVEDGSAVDLVSSSLALTLFRACWVELGCEACGRFVWI